jgi:hypothetical protein
VLELDAAPRLSATFGENASTLGAARAASGWASVLALAEQRPAHARTGPWYAHAPPTNPSYKRRTDPIRSLCPRHAERCRRAIAFTQPFRPAADDAVVFAQGQMTAREIVETFSTR